VFGSDRSFIDWAKEHAKSQADLQRVAKTFDDLQRCEPPKGHRAAGGHPATGTLPAGPVAHRNFFLLCRIRFDYSDRDYAIMRLLASVGDTIDAEIGVTVFAHEVPAKGSNREEAVATVAHFLGREVARADVIVWAVSGWVVHIDLLRAVSVPRLAFRVADVARRPDLPIDPALADRQGHLLNQHENL
jgi:hypothetical protein